MNILRGIALAIALTFLIGCGKSGDPTPGKDNKDGPKGISAGDAGKQEGKPVTVDMKVGFVFAHKDGLILAEEDIAGKDFKAVTVLIPTDKVASFGGKNANEVGDKYDGKKITVSGKVAKRTLDVMSDGKPAKVERSVIEVTEPAQIKE
jgi:hypothetical protein